jgi:hypothetical protein
VDACPEDAGVVVARRLPAAAGESWDIEHLWAWDGRVAEQSSVFELLDILKVVEEFRAEWKGKCVQICSGNVGAVFMMSRGCMKKAVCIYLAEEFGGYAGNGTLALVLSTLLEMASLQLEQMSCHEIQIMGIAS